MSPEVYLVAYCTRTQVRQQHYNDMNVCNVCKYVCAGAPYLCGHLTVFLRQVFGQLTESVVLIGQEGVELGGHLPQRALWKTHGYLSRPADCSGDNVHDHYHQQLPPTAVEQRTC